VIAGTGAELPLSEIDLDATRRVSEEQLVVISVPDNRPPNRRRLSAPE
jgi:hypothetical protein